MTTIEHMICSDPAIAEADRLLNRLWTSLSTQDLVTEELRISQRNWLTRRDSCLIADEPNKCVRDIMLERIAVLSEL